MIETPFSRHGPVRVAEEGRHLAHADGTPFFLLADTAWNGPLLANEAEWQVYLADRAAKGFTAIQFIAMAPWAGAYTDADGHTAFDPRDPSRVNPEFFDRMDQRIAAINAAGLLAVPVLAWAANFGESAEHNPGHALGAKALESLIRHQVERFGARAALWLLAGDGRYGGWRSWKWKRIGRSLVGSALRTDSSPIRKSVRSADPTVGMHPMGKTWPYGSYRHETWLDLLGYQTSHSTDSRTLDWLLTGPPTTAWQHDKRPIINLEPCYEGIRNGETGKPITNADVRRAMYASLLNAPTAGVSYGAHGVWSWQSTPREPLNHPGTGVAQPWHEAMRLPGSDDVARLAAIFTSIDWWRLRPAQELLLSQPARDPAGFVSVSAAEQHDLVLAYLPRGGEIELNREVTAQLSGEWLNPRTGLSQPAGIRLAAPDAQDWVLLMRRRVV